MGTRSPFPFDAFVLRSTWDILVLPSRSNLLVEIPQNICWFPYLFHLFPFIFHLMSIAPTLSLLAETFGDFTFTVLAGTSSLGFMWFYSAPLRNYRNITPNCVTTASFLILTIRYSVTTRSFDYIFLYCATLTAGTLCKMYQVRSCPGSLLF